MKGLSMLLGVCVFTAFVFYCFTYMMSHPFSWYAVIKAVGVFVVLMLWIGFSIPREK